ncbi:MAG: methylmalonyl-CoA carboxyltransferase [Clostridia bacterium]|nr:methylmalonyl-CoA carboxyltransferase [Clostridia bacterium]
MSVERNLPIVRDRRQAALTGDAEQIKRQHDAGKLTARERVARLFDEASFVELDTLIADAGVITGYGLVDGHPAYVYAQDYTVKAGALGAAQAKKILKVLSLAEKTGAPVVALCDSHGARLDEGMNAVNAYASIMAKSADLSGVIPQISVVLGPCGGGAAMCAEMADIVIIGKNGQLFVNGPQLVSAATGKNITMEDMAGAAASVKSGAAHIAAGSDEDAIDQARKIVALLPGNNLEDAPYAFEREDDINRELADLNAIDTLADARDAVVRIADNAEVIELGETYAPEVVTALARLGGSAVGFVATQGAQKEGRLTVEGCRKAARFVRFLDSFSIPVVTLVDTMGAAANTAAQGELARANAALMGAYADATCPRVAIVTGNAIGTAATALASRAASDVIYAWPGAVISPVTAKVAAQLYGEKELHEAANPDEVRAKLEEDYQNNVADGVNAALQGNVDDVIEPALTRQMIAAALEMLAGKRESKPARKHGNLPL